MTKYNKKGAGFFGSVKATMTSMNKTCKEIWLNYLTSLQSLIDEIDVFYRDANMENILLTLYKTDYNKSQILNEFEMIKIKVRSLSDVMSGKTKSYYGDPNGKLCSDFVYTDMDGKKDAMTFDQYLQGLQKKLMNIRVVMKTVDVPQSQPISSNIKTNTSEIKTNSTNVNTTDTKINNANVQKKGWLSSAKDKVLSAMPKTCQQLWDTHKSEIFTLIDEIDTFWKNNDMASNLKKRLYVDTTTKEKLNTLLLFSLIKDRISKIDGRMMNEKFEKHKQSRVTCLYFIPEPDFDDYNSFDTYLKDLKQGLFDVKDAMQTIDMSIFQNASNTQSAGKKQNRNKSYIKMKTTQKQYLVHRDDANRKFIKQKGTDIYLSDIRGKYLNIHS